MYMGGNIYCFSAIRKTTVEIRLHSAVFLLKCVLARSKKDKVPIKSLLHTSDLDKR
jgi:hypothetical protein